MPVLTGIGHDIDRTVADEVAHAAYKTPTACAQAVVDDVRAFERRTVEALAAAWPRCRRRLRRRGRRGCARADATWRWRPARAWPAADRDLAPPAPAAACDRAATGPLDRSARLLERSAGRTSVERTGPPARPRVGARGGRGQRLAHRAAPAGRGGRARPRPARGPGAGARPGPHAGPGLVDHPRRRQGRVVRSATDVASRATPGRRRWPTASVRSTVDGGADGASCDDLSREIGYAAALAELEGILDELDGDEVDVDVLGARVRRARRAAAPVPRPHRQRPLRGRAGGGRARGRGGRARPRPRRDRRRGRSGRRLPQGGAEPREPEVGAGERSRHPRHPHRNVVTAMRSRSSAASPPSLRAVAARVDERLARLFDAEITRWQAVDPAIAAPLCALRRLVDAGGKRLRPAFCYWGFVGAGGDPDDPCVIDAGAAFELLHAFALVHDDVMDGSDTRRGARTAHLEFAGQHAGRRLAGRGPPLRRGRRHPRSATWPTSTPTCCSAGAAPTPPASGTSCASSSTSASTSTCSAPPAATATGSSPDRIARYKSGKYTIERPLHVGAALAGRLDDLAAPLSAYGDPLGEAFQLRDDVLGAFGDPERHRQAGRRQDLREGKPTPLLAAAASRADDGGTEPPRPGRRSRPVRGEVAAIQRVLVGQRRPRRDRGGHRAAHHPGDRRHRRRRHHVPRPRRARRPRPLRGRPRRLIAAAPCRDRWTSEAANAPPRPSRSTSRTPGSAATASSHGGRTAAQTVSGRRAPTASRPGGRRWPRSRRADVAGQLEQGVRVGRPRRVQRFGQHEGVVGLGAPTGEPGSVVEDAPRTSSGRAPADQQRDVRAEPPAESGRRAEVGQGGVDVGHSISAV